MTRDEDGLVKSGGRASECLDRGVDWVQELHYWAFKKEWEDLLRFGAVCISVDILNVPLSEYIACLPRCGSLHTEYTLFNLIQCSAVSKLDLCISALYKLVRAHIICKSVRRASA